LRQKRKEKNIRENEERRLKNVEKRRIIYRFDQQTVTDVENNATIDKEFKFREKK